MKAAELGHLQALQLLKEAMADPSLRDKDGKGIFFEFGTK
jgi:hypothetical protein